MQLMIFIQLRRLVLSCSNGRPDFMMVINDNAPMFNVKCFNIVKTNPCRVNMSWKFNHLVIVDRCIVDTLYRNLSSYCCFFMLLFISKLRSTKFRYQPQNINLRFYILKKLCLWGISLTNKIFIFSFIHKIINKIFSVLFYRLGCPDVRS